jgi:hypothetical protein
VTKSQNLDSGACPKYRYEAYAGSVVVMPAHAGIQEICGSALDSGLPRNDEMTASHREAGAQKTLNP